MYIDLKLCVCACLNVFASVEICDICRESQHSQTRSKHFVCEK